MSQGWLARVVPGVAFISWPPVSGQSDNYPDPAGAGASHQECHCFCPPGCVQDRGKIKCLIRIEYLEWCGFLEVGLILKLDFEILKSLVFLQTSLLE